MLRTFADRVHAGRTREIVADDDAPADVQAGIDGELHVRTNARRDDDEVAIESRSVGELEPLHVAVAENGGGARFEVRAQSHALELRAAARLPPRASICASIR